MTDGVYEDREELVTKLRDQAYELYDQREFSRARELFEKAFDGIDPYIAAHLGWIYSQADLPDYDSVKAEEHYLIAAKAGLTSAYRGLASLYFQQGNMDKAFHYCSEASLAGDAECSWALQSRHRREGQFDLQKVALDRAADQGHPLAVQRRAIDDLLFRNGAKHFGRGITAYLLNIRPLFRYVMQNAHKWK